jgi:hypothetical protein
MVKAEDSVNHTRTHVLAPVSAGGLRCDPPPMGIRLGFTTERQTVLTLAALSALLTLVLTAPALVAALALG